jgi:hypothetical protein
LPGHVGRQEQLVLPPHDTVLSCWSFFCGFWIGRGSRVLLKFVTCLALLHGLEMPFQVVAVHKLGAKLCDCALIVYDV